MIGAQRHAGEDRRATEAGTGWRSHRRRNRGSRQELEEVWAGLPPSLIRKSSNSRGPAARAVRGQLFLVRAPGLGSSVTAATGPIQGLVNGGPGTRCPPPRLQPKSTSGTLSHLQGHTAVHPELRSASELEFSHGPSHGGAPSLSICSWGPPTILVLLQSTHCGALSAFI